MAAPLIVYIDTTNKVQIASFLAANQPGSPMIFEAGDNPPIQLHFLQRNPSSNVAGQLAYSYIDPGTVTPVSVAMGVIGAVPTGGTFTVTFNTTTTAALAYNISASALSTALNGLAPIISLGGVSVVGNAGGPFTVTFTATGAPGHEFVINASELVPVSQGITAIAIAGGTGIQEQEVLTLLQSPAALQTSWTATYGAIAVSQLQTGGVSGSNSIQRVTVPTGTYAGSFSLIFGAAQTVSIAFNASASVVQAALAALSTIGVNNVAVVASSTTTWDITFQGSLAGSAQAAIVPNGVGLMSPMYLAAQLNLNTTGIFAMLVGVDSASPTFQVQQGTSGNINTVLQTTVTLNATLIQGTPSDPIAANPWQTLSEVLALIDTPANLPLATTTTVGAVQVPTSGGLQVDGSGNLTTNNRNTRVVTSIPITSNVILANLAGLTSTLTAGVAYSFEATLFTTASASGGVQASISGTATATSIEYEGILTSAAAIATQTRATALGGVVCSSASATAGTLYITGTILVNAGGTLTVQFAQNTTNASASTVLAGSWFKVWQDSN